MKLRAMCALLAILMIMSALASCAKSGSETAQTDATQATEGATGGSTEEVSSEGKTETETEGETTVTTDPRAENEAYYIIEAVADYGRNGLANGWNYDNRFNLTDTSGKDYSVLHDKSDEKFYRLIRDFEAESNGYFKLEMIISAASCANKGVYVSMCNENDEPIFSLTPRNGKWTFVGADIMATDIEVPEEASKKFAIEIEFDLNTDKAKLTIDNKYCGEASILDGHISRLILGTNKVGTGSIAFSYVRLMKNYPLSERFLLPADAETGLAPTNWEVTGDFKLQRIDSMRLYDMYSVQANSKAGTVSTAKKSFNKVSGRVSFETMVLLRHKTDGAKVSLTSGGKEVITFETRDGGKFYVGDLMAHDYGAYVWQTLHIEADTYTQKAEIYVNGKLRGEVDFDAEYFDGVFISFAPDSDTEMWFDDVEINEVIQHADYPEEPQVAESTDYNIGMNVCWLWRDQQSGEGWDATSPFSEFDSYLGFYDEGLRETADWELKWMAEHGVDFVHVCWYAPQANTMAPIKEMRHSYAALHDGYMMAEYSDLVDFCIMWENNSVDCTSFATWRQYIWDYWVEYYFSDPRYARIDNKAVLTIWSMGNLYEAFGGEKEVKKVLKFMDAELKKMGYDGLILLASVQGTTTPERYQELADLGYSGTYAYHWGATGYDPQHQINCNESNIANSNGILHHIPTVSIGFNDVGRNETRDPIISVQDHELVCKEIKKSLSKFNTGTWKDNTLFISTWNEYSEGTYLFPTESTGFEYLENIRRIFTNDTSDHSSIDVRPTEAQVDRITHLYPPNHSPIRWLQYEKADTQFDYFVNVNGSTLKFTFAPKLLENGDLEVVGEAKKRGFYSALRLYHEWDRFTGDGVLTLYTYEDKKIVFTVGSDKATVDGQVVELGYTFTLRDGLPVFHIKQLCELIGYKYAYENNTVYVQACSDKEYETLKYYVPNQWEFNVPGELEGWRNQNSIGSVSDTGTMLITPTGADVAVIQPVDFYSSAYTVVRIGIKYDENIVKQAACLFFTTTKSSGYSSDKCITAKYDYAGKGPGDTVEAVFILGNNLNYSGKINGIRIDPFTGLFPCEIDYIRCEYDKKYSLESDVVYVDGADQWEFNEDGKKDGWTTSNVHVDGIKDGFFNATAKTSDPLMHREVNIKASDYHVLVVGMKYFEGLESTNPQIYFQTSEAKSWDESRTVRGTFAIPEEVAEGDVINIYFPLNLATWKGTIVAIRFDPFGAAKSFSIDYIRFAKRISKDPTLAPMETIFNITDAANLPEGLTVNGSDKNTVSVVDDPTAAGNKVFKVECTKGTSNNTTYTYFNVNLDLIAGKSYVIQYKIMPLTDYAGNDFANTIIGGNLIYANEGGGKANHTFDGGENKSTSDEWITVSAIVKVPNTYDATKGGALQIWGKFSPESGYGISYLVKDILVGYQLD